LYMGYKSAITHRSLHHQLTEVERLSQEKQQLLAMQNAMLERQLVQQTNEVMLERQLEAQRVSQLRSDFERRVAEAEMTGLRSQMNPHFIFNCLNSIKLYAVDNESEKASEYLTKFSRLIRMVLENSRSERVTLQN
ncbi:histidine kinase, partial [Corallococcus praedator]